MLDWPEFLDNNGIEYKREGMRNIRISCPWCQSDKMHMAISTLGRGWHCWKRPEHRGGQASRLIAALINCSIQQARLIAGETGEATADNFVSRMDAFRHGFAVDEPEPELTLPDEFKPITDLPTARPIIRYLQDEQRGGFDMDSILRLTQDYGMYYCLHGRFRYRVIFSILAKGKLVAWTGRSIVRKEPKRYLAEGKPPHYLLWYDKLRKGGESIVLTEGPFDALKLMLLGQPATCFFTSGPSQQQVDLLNELLPRYRKRALLLDQGAWSTALSTQSRLAALSVKVAYLPPGIKDPALLKNLDCLKAVF